MAAAVASRHHRVGKGEEGSVIAALLPEPLDVEVELVVEHCLQPPTRDITLRVPINGVAHFHVVSRDALRDRPAAPATGKNPRTTSLPAPIPADVSYPPRTR